MRIIVNSTSMMQPIFDSHLGLNNQNINNKTYPNQRATGILESANEDDLRESKLIERKPLFYLHPNTDILPETSANWDEIQTIASRNQSLSFVVFGFYYDGEHDWLKVWVKTQKRYLWIQRQLSMTYRSYAALTMNALSKIPPTWDGVLHCSPFRINPSEMAENHDTERDIVMLNSFSKGYPKSTEAIVTDAAANEQGELWFSVVISSTDDHSTAHNQQMADSGWISANSDY